MCCCSVLQCVAVWFEVDLMGSHSFIIQSNLWCVHCNTLQHAATHGNTYEYVKTLFSLRTIACVLCCMHCNTLHHAASRCNALQNKWIRQDTLLSAHYRVRPVIVCTATRRNTPQHAATHCNTHEYVKTLFSLRTIACVLCCMHCNTLQHAATHCNTL